MKNVVKSPVILNLSGELFPSLLNYFIKKGIEIIDPLESEEIRDWTHIITKDIFNFDQLNIAYDTVQFDRKIISLSPVADLQNFILNNGNMILDEMWFKEDLGSLIMDKYFLGYGGVSLNDNYPVFEEEGAFVVTNLFSYGDNIDRLVHKAFLAGMQALVIKSYFDHLLMYLSGLQGEEKASVPYQVSYGRFKDTYSVQISFHSKNLDILDFSGSLNSSISKSPEEYVLNIAVQSSDFFDFSYLPTVKKVAITALWSKDRSLKFENRGFMLSSPSSEAADFVFNTQNLTPGSIVPHQDNLEDFSHKVFLPSSVPQGVSSEVISDFSMFTKDEKDIIEGASNTKDFVELVKDKVKEGKDSYLSQGGKFDIEKAVQKIVASIDDSAKEKNMVIRSLGSELAIGVRQGLFDFAKNINKEIEDLDVDDLDNFEVRKIPEILRDKLIKSSSRPLFETDENLSRPVENHDHFSNTISSLKKENAELKAMLMRLKNEMIILKKTNTLKKEISIKASHLASTVVNESRDNLEKREREHDFSDQKKIRMMEIEAENKDHFLRKELERAQREVRSKDIMLIKFKDGISELLEKKDLEVQDLRKKNDDLRKSISSDSSAKSSMVIKDLEKQKISLKKQLQVYKNKIESLSSRLFSSGDENNIDREVRKLSLQNQHIKNNLDFKNREIEKLKARLSSSNSKYLDLRQQNVSLEKKLKAASAEIKGVQKQSGTESRLLDIEVKRLNSEKKFQETQLKQAWERISELEVKLAEASKAQKVTTEDDGSRVKVVQLETSMRKLSSDLSNSKNQMVEAKKEINKLRLEKNSLQNQIEKLKKELEKLKKRAA